MHFISIKPQPQKYAPNHGDFIYGDISFWIKPLKKDLFAQKKIMYLACLGYNHWRVLDLFNLFDKSSFIELKKNSEYECPITEKIYTSILPVALIVNDMEPYVKSIGQEYEEYKNKFADQEYQKYLMEQILEEVSLDNLTQVFLGSGYTGGCYPSDGMPGNELVLVELSNGDHMLCHTLIWFNK